MDNAKVLEIQQAAAMAASDIVKAQIANGAPNRGMSKARHAAVVADVTHEIVSSFPAPQGEDESKWIRQVLRATYSGSLLNASQLRQDLEKAGVLQKEGPLTNEYGV